LTTQKEFQSSLAFQDKALLFEGSKYSGTDGLIKPGMLIIREAFDR
jgi:hypothetical protein